MSSVGCKLLLSDKITYVNGKYRMVRSTCLCNHGFAQLMTVRNHFPTVNADMGLMVEVIVVEM